MATHDAQWTYTKDASGDWRGVSNDGQYRTRLKGSLVWAKRDVNINRLQYRRGDVWVDEIDGKQHRYTMPAEPMPSEQMKAA